MRRRPRDRGKIALGSLLVDYQPGQKVRILVNPAVQKGMPHRRYHGRIGMIAEKRGRSYVVDITAVEGKVLRHIIARPEHIEPVEENK